ncbi:MAG: PH domain-containing protein [Verrucomicrobiota bacterium]
MKEFSAHWSTSLRLISILTTIVLLVVAYFIYPTSPPWGRFAAAFSLLVLVGSLLFTIRGYALDPNTKTLHIKRLFWNTTVSLEHLESATPDPEAMRNSIRLLGNGGLYSFSGIFRNEQLGTFRSFVTNPKHCVVLKFASEKPIVVSPTDRPDFLELVRTRLANNETR